MEMDPWTLLLAAVVIILIILLAVVWSGLTTARTELADVRREMDFRVEKRVAEEKDQIRVETLDRSRATLKGRVAEQMVPFLEEFKYNPSDARFIGSPIDYVIFDGYTELKDGDADRPITVVLADVKTGARAQLTSTQRRIQDAVEEGRVEWETIHVRGEEDDLHE